MSVHDGHRERKRSQFLTSGPDSFADHELLEMLLYYVIQRQDTNPIAHSLIQRFGSLKDVLCASPEELMEVPYIKERAAVLIRLAGVLYQRALLAETDQEELFDTLAKIGNYFCRRFIGQSKEILYQLCLDNHGKKRGLYKLSEGDIDSASLSIRKVMENTLYSKSTMVVLAHNHPSGIALPSETDVITTKMVRDALETMNVRLIDHVIVASDGDYVSLAESGLL